MWSFIDRSAKLSNSCCLCGAAANRLLCPGCLSDLPAITTPCPRCALHCTGLAEGDVCPTCTSTPPPQSITLTGCAYQWPVSRMIGDFKDRGRLTLGEALLPPLLARVRQTYLPGQLPRLLLPVPVTRHRLRQRGYNQSLLLADSISREIGIPVQRGLLRRVRATAQQRGLNRIQRSSNPRGGFTVTGMLCGQHIALVDDVITTGSTVAEASRVLLEAGASRVSVWGLARAPLHSSSPTRESSCAIRSTS